MKPIIVNVLYYHLEFLILHGSLSLMYIHYNCVMHVTIRHTLYCNYWKHVTSTLTFNVPCNMFVVFLLSTQVYLDYLSSKKVITLELVPTQKKGAKDGTQHK
jgi:hypothetical protein